MMEAVVNSSRTVERIAPSGAPLATGRARPLSGAALASTVERQLRAADGPLAAWNLPLSDYTFSLDRVDPPGSATYGWFFARSDEALEATFTQRKTGAKIIVTQIWVNDDGKIIQWGSQYGDLVL